MKFLETQETPVMSHMRSMRHTMPIPMLLNAACFPFRFDPGTLMTGQSSILRKNTVICASEVLRKKL
jgi:hypothetical protein